MSSQKALTAVTDYDIDGEPIIVVPLTEVSGLAASNPRHARMLANSYHLALLC